MPEASPNPARGAQPGRFQRPKVRPVTFRRVRLDVGEHEPTYWWKSDGELFHDRELTQPTGLTIVEIVD